MKYHHGRWLVEIMPDFQNPYEATMAVREGDDGHRVVYQKLKIVENASRFKKQTTIRQAHAEGLISDDEIIAALLRGGSPELSKEIVVLDKDCYFDHVALRLIDYGIKHGYWKTEPNQINVEPSEMNADERALACWTCTDHRECDKCPVGIDGIKAMLDAKYEGSWKEDPTKEG
jgi:hypothetical protein